MDMDLLLIFGFILVAASMVFSFARKAHQRTVEHEERRLELKAREAEAKSGGGGEAYRKLEERVRVLERIATDGNSRLAAEIEDLRNLQDLDALPRRSENAR